MYIAQCNCARICYLGDIMNFKCINSSCVFSGAVTWNVTCTYSQFLSQKTPTCCVSLSSFYNETIVPCPTCSCGCQNNITQPGSCVEWVTINCFINQYVFSCDFIVLMLKLKLHDCYCRADSPYLASAISAGSSKGNINTAPLVQCTNHMCPVRIHWHVKVNYKDYWRVKVTITNFNYRMNYTQWNLVVQHPNFDNLTQAFSFRYKGLTPYDGLSKFWFS